MLNLSTGDAVRLTRLPDPRLSNKQAVITARLPYGYEVLPEGGTLKFCVSFDAIKEKING